MFVVFGVENCSNSVICFVLPVFVVFGVENCSNSVILFGVGNCSNSVICLLYLVLRTVLTV